MDRAGTRRRDGTATQHTIRVACGFALVGLTVLRFHGIEAGAKEHGIGRFISYCGGGLDLATVGLLASVIEPVVGVLLLLRRSADLRRAAFVGATWMTVAATGSAYLGLSGADLRDCWCFGTLDAPWWVHTLVAAPIAVGCAAVYSWTSVDRPGREIAR